MTRKSGERPVIIGTFFHETAKPQELLYFTLENLDDSESQIWAHRIKLKELSNKCTNLEYSDRHLLQLPNQKFGPLISYDIDLENQENQSKDIQNLIKFFKVEDDPSRWPSHEKWDLMSQKQKDLMIEDKLVCYNLQFDEDYQGTFYRDLYTILFTKTEFDSLSKVSELAYSNSFSSESILDILESKKSISNLQGQFYCIKSQFTKPVELDGNYLKSTCFYSELTIHCASTGVEKFFGLILNRRNAPQSYQILAVWPHIDQAELKLEQISELFCAVSFSNEKTCQQNFKVLIIKEDFKVYNEYIQHGNNKEIQNLVKPVLFANSLSEIGDWYPFIWCGSPLPMQNELLVGNMEFNMTWTRISMYPYRYVAQCGGGGILLNKITDSGSYFYAQLGSASKYQQGHIQQNVTFDVWTSTVFQLSKLNIRSCEIVSVRFNQIWLIQSLDNVIAYNQKSQTLTYLVNDHEQMLTFQLQGSFNDRAYFAKKSKMHQLIRVEIFAFYKNDEIKSQEISFQDREILALQVSNERPEYLEDDIDCVYIYLNDGFFLSLHVGKKSYQQFQKFRFFPYDQFCKQKQLLDGWGQVFISKRSITLNRPRKDGRPYFETLPRTRWQDGHHHPSAVYIMMLQSITKILFVLDENGKTFFLLKPNPETKRIELFRNNERKQTYLTKILFPPTNKLIFQGLFSGKMCQKKFLNTDLMLTDYSEQVDNIELLQQRSPQLLKFYSKQNQEIFRFDDSRPQPTRIRANFQNIVQVHKEFLKALIFKDWAITNASITRHLFVDKNGQACSIFFSYPKDNINLSQSLRFPEFKQINELTPEHPVLQRMVLKNETNGLVSNKFSQFEKEDIIYCIWWDKLDQAMLKDSQAFLISKFIVVRFKELLFYFTLNEEDFIEILPHYGPFKAIQLDIKVQFMQLLVQTEIPLKKFIAPEDFASDFKVAMVQDFDFKCIARLKFSSNHQLIQISFKNKTIVWNLYTNSEIQTLYDVDDFDVVDFFQLNNFFICQSRIKGHLCQHSNFPLNTLFQSCAFGGRPSLFKLFCDLDLLEARYIINQQQKHRIPKLIGVDMVSANFYGYSFFDILGTKLDYLQATVHSFEKFKEINEQKDVDQKKDSVEVRKLYYTLGNVYRENLNDNCKPSMLVQLLLNQFSPHDNIFNDKNVQLLKQKNLQNGILKRLKYQSRKQSNDSLFNKRIIYPFQFQYSSTETMLSHVLTTEGIEKRDQIKECLFKLLSLSSDISLTALIRDLKDFKNILEDKSSLVRDLLDKTFRETSETEKIQFLEVHPSFPMVVAHSNTKNFDADTIKKLAKDAQFDHLVSRSVTLRIKSFCLKKKFLNEFKQDPVPVQVFVVDLSWINGQITDLFKILKTQINNQNSDWRLVRTLVTPQDYTLQLFFLIMLPQVFLTISTQNYFIEVVSNYQTGAQELSISSILFFMITIWFIFVEILQVEQYRIRYLNDTSNIIIQLQFLLNIAIFIHYSLRANFIGIDLLVPLVSLDSLLTWFICFDYMRMFSQTGFYIRLLKETIHDARFFGILFVMCITMFGSTVYLIFLSQNYFTGSDDLFQCSFNFDDILGYDLSFFSAEYLDALVNQYLLSFGEFNISTFEQSTQRNLLWFLFLLSTFLTQLLFMNMVIAIMGDTFQRVVEQRRQYALMERIQFTLDFSTLLSLDKRIVEEPFAYVIFPKIEQVDESEWEGSFKNRINNLENEVKEISADLKKSVLANIKVNREDIRKQFVESQAQQECFSEKLKKNEEQMLLLHKKLDSIAKLFINQDPKLDFGTLQSRLEQQSQRKSHKSVISFLNTK